MRPMRERSSALLTVAVPFLMVVRRPSDPERMGAVSSILPLQDDTAVSRVLVLSTTLLMTSLIVSSTKEPKVRLSRARSWMDREERGAAVSGEASSAKLMIILVSIILGFDERCERCFFADIVPTSSDFT